MSAHEITSDEMWREVRARHIGSSEVGALFDASPYFTRFALWHAKAGNATLPPADNQRVEWGRLLEPAIAEGIARQMRWSLVKSRVYHSSDTVKGMGCTVDYDVVDHTDGPGIVEVKNVDWLEWKKSWTDSAAPRHIELQLQHQLACTARPWGAIGALVGGNDLKIYERQPKPRIIAEIERKVSAFWQSVERGQAPDAFGQESELDTLAQLFPLPEEGKQLEIADPTLAQAAADYLWAKAQERLGKTMATRAKVRLLAAAKDAELMLLPGFLARRSVTSSGAVRLKVLQIEGGPQPQQDLNPFA